MLVVMMLLSFYNLMVAKSKSHTSKDVSIRNRNFLDIFVDLSNITCFYAEGS
jgi:hypothetical protein